VQLLPRLGFRERAKGSYHIFFRDGVTEILNLQADSGTCKPYRVKQVRNVIIQYGLAGEADDEIRDHHLLEPGRRSLCRRSSRVPGCAADGKTHKEALANVETVIQEWIETAKELGRRIPAPRGR
jgi:hypothetical protein